MKQHKYFWRGLLFSFVLLFAIPAISIMQEPIKTEAAAPKLNKKKASIKEGKTVTLKVKNPTSKVKWSTSNASVVTVTKKSGSKKANATLKGMRAGTANVTAKIGKKKLTAKITVTHVHQWRGYNTCTEPDKCIKCGATRGNAAGHNWMEATCQKLSTCQVCGATQGKLKAHQFYQGFCSMCNLRKLDDFITLYFDEDSVGNGSCLYLYCGNEINSYLKVCDTVSNIGTVTAYDANGRRLADLGLYMPDSTGKFTYFSGYETYTSGAIWLIFRTLDGSDFVFPATGSIRCKLWYSTEQYEVDVKYSVTGRSNFTYKRLN